MLQNREFDIRFGPSKNFMFFILFFITKFLCTNDNKAPESIIAKVEIDEKCPKNEIEILKCCLQVLPVTTDEEMEREEEIKKEEILF